MQLLVKWELIPPGVDPIMFLVVATLAVMLLSAAKSGFGGSMGMLSTPLMILACKGQSQLATGIMLPVMIACDYVTLVVWWGKWDRRNVRMLVPGMLVGVLLGGLTLWAIFGTPPAGGRVPASAPTQSMMHSNAILNLSIGLVAVGFVVLQVLRSWKGELNVFKPTAVQATIAGAAAGYVSTLAHTAGPITNMYLLPQNMDKGRFVATTVLYYWIGNQVKLVPYAMLGMLSTPSLKADLLLLPGMILGAVLGIVLHHRVSDKQFNTIIYAFLGVIGLYMIATSVGQVF